MEIGAKRYFPYPVLWLDEKSDYKNGSFHCEIDVIHNVNGNNLQVKFAFLLQNHDLIERISNNEVFYLVHIECPASGYRDVIKSKLDNGATLIPEKLLSGELQICTFLVAATEIIEYSNYDYVDEIRDIPYQIKPGCILGIAETYKYYIDTQKSDLGYLPSVIFFSKNEDPLARAIEADFYGKRIVIKLPLDTFSQYQRIQRIDKRSTPILYSIFIIPALVYVMSELKKIDTENRELEFSEFNWYRAINQRLSAKNYPTIDSEDYSDLDVLRVVQEILDNPPFLALNELNNAWTNSLEDEE